MNAQEARQKAQVNKIIVEERAAKKELEDIYKQIERMVEVGGFSIDVPPLMLQTIEQLRKDGFTYADLNNHKAYHYEIKW